MSARTQNPDPHDDRPTAIRAAWVADGEGRVHAPGILLLRGRVTVAVGSPQSVGALPPDTARVDEPDAGILPALVNAHCHLDLTLAGTLAEPSGDPDGFLRWLAGVRGLRMAMDPSMVAASVREGVQQLVVGGVAAVGDIAGMHALEPSLHACDAAGLAGCVFEEFFGMGPRLPLALAAVDAAVAAPAPAGRMRRGLQPHAPYSSDRRVYEAALRSGLPVSTHAAEFSDEREFLASGTGRFRGFLESLGLWDGSFEAGSPHPVAWIASRLAAARGSRILAAHVNDLDDGALDHLARLPVAVAYCPRAGEYFGHRGHPYRDMLARGVNVCLGTDSALCLGTPGRISPLDDLRLLMRRDGLELGQALAMATVAGARALGLAPEAFAFGGAPLAGILAVPLDGRRAPAEFGKTASAPRWVLGLRTA